MTIQVHPDWWKTLFDEVYLITDARSVCDPRVTRKEVDIICELLPLKTKHKILDLCGGHGRHSLELCRRGYSDCTLVDYSRCLIDHAAAQAEKENQSINLLQSDAGDTGLISESFDCVLILGNSLGYTALQDADQKILCEAFRLLKSGGWLLADVANGKAVKQSFSSCAWHEIGDDMVVCRERDLKGDKITAREMVISKRKGIIRDKTYAIRFYEPPKFKRLLEFSGFKEIDIHTDFSSHYTEGDYGFMNNRMFALAQKP